MYKILVMISRTAMAMQNPNITSQSEVLEFDSVYLADIAYHNLVNTVAADTFHTLLAVRLYAFDDDNVL